jgi:flagellar biosynthesis chaperone FliJ
MAASASLRRLLAIRLTEEEQRQMEMEKAVAELQRLEGLQNKLRTHFKCVRELFESSAHTGETVDRIAALREISADRRLETLLAEKIEVARMDIERKKQGFLAKRLERRQVETLVDRMSAEGATEAGRKLQAALDDWHRSRRISKNP